MRPEPHARTSDIRIDVAAVFAYDDSVVPYLDDHCALARRRRLTLVFDPREQPRF